MKGTGPDKAVEHREGPHHRVIDGSQAFVTEDVDKGVKRGCSRCLCGGKHRSSARPCRRNYAAPGRRKRAAPMPRHRRGAERQSNRADSTHRDVGLDGDHVLDVVHPA